MGIPMSTHSRIMEQGGFARVSREFMRKHNLVRLKNPSGDGYTLLAQDDFARLKKRAYILLNAHGRYYGYLFPHERQALKNFVGQENVAHISDGGVRAIFRRIEAFQTAGIPPIFLPEYEIPNSNFSSINYIILLVTGKLNANKKHDKKHSLLPGVEDVLNFKTIAFRNGKIDPLVIREYLNYVAESFKFQDKSTKKDILQLHRGALEHLERSLCGLNPAQERVFNPYRPGKLDFLKWMPFWFTRYTEADVRRIVADYKEQLIDNPEYKLESGFARRMFSFFPEELDVEEIKAARKEKMFAEAENGNLKVLAPKRLREEGVRQHALELIRSKLEELEVQILFVLSELQKLFAAKVLRDREVLNIVRQVQLERARRLENEEFFKIFGQKQVNTYYRDFSSKGAGEKDKGFFSYVVDRYCKLILLELDKLNPENLFNTSYLNKIYGIVLMRKFGEQVLEVRLKVVKELNSERFRGIFTSGRVAAYKKQMSESGSIGELARYIVDRFDELEKK